MRWSAIILLGVCLARPILAEEGVLGQLYNMRDALMATSVDELSKKFGDDGQKYKDNQSKILELRGQILKNTNDIRQTQSEVQKLSEEIEANKRILSLLAQKNTKIWQDRIALINIFMVHFGKNTNRAIRNGDTHNNAKRLMVMQEWLHGWANDAKIIKANWHEANEFQNALNERYILFKTSQKHLSENQKQWAKQLEILEQLQKQAKIYQQHLENNTLLPPSNEVDSLDKLMHLTPFGEQKNGQAQQYLRPLKEITPPFDGAIETQFNKIDETGSANRGVVYRGHGTIIAPFDGIINFADDFKQQKRVVIITHINGYTSVFTGMDKLLVINGQTILEGEPIGLIFQENNDKTSLYFQLNQNNEPVNPLRYFKKP